jgi:hypothetical protein
VLLRSARCFLSVAASLMWRTKKMELLKKEAKAAEAQKKQ